LADVWLGSRFGGTEGAHLEPAAAGPEQSESATQIFVHAPHGHADPGSMQSDPDVHDPPGADFVAGGAPALFDELEHDPKATTTSPNANARGSDLIRDLLVQNAWRNASAPSWKSTRRLDGSRGPSA
jgi:hypothetical protein